MIEKSVASFAARHAAERDEYRDQHTKAVGEQAMTVRVRRAVAVEEAAVHYEVVVEASSA